AEVDKLYFSAVAHHHVLGTQVSVHDVQWATSRIGPFVDVNQGFGKRHRYSDAIGPRHRGLQLRGALADLTQITTFNVLQHYVWFAGLVRRRFKHLSDARVLELSLDPGFVEKARQKRTVSGMLSAHQFHDAGPFGAFDAARTA